MNLLTSTELKKTICAFVDSLTIGNVPKPVVTHNLANETEVEWRAKDGPRPRNRHRLLVLTISPDLSLRYAFLYDVDSSCGKLWVDLVGVEVLAEFLAIIY